MKTSKIFLLVAVAAGLAACTVKYVSPAQQCQMSGRTDCHEDFMQMKSFTEDSSPFGSQVYLFNAMYASANISGSNVPVITTATNATIRLKENGSTIATASFPMLQSGGVFTFTNPSAVTSWVHANAYDADEYVISLDTISFEKKPGTNLVVVEWVYDGSVKTGNSWSGYSPPDNGGGGGYQQEK